MEQGIQTCLTQISNKAAMTTLKKTPEGTKTADMTETLNLMLEHLIPEDNPNITQTITGQL